MRITFVKSRKAYLPEIIAYAEFFAMKGHSVSLVDSANQIESHTDLLWRFCGLDPMERNSSLGMLGNKKVYSRSIRLVHEYASLSTPPFARSKDFVKRNINRLPDARVFLNDDVRAGLSFSDNVPYRIRDMGISSEFLSTSSNLISKDFDFVYVGAITRHRGVDLVLDKIAQSVCSILLIGEPESYFIRKYRSCRNIRFAGRLDYRQIPNEAAKARIGINVVPNVYPYQFQTSTKVLEYCALGLGVASVPTKWVAKFAHIKSANFYLFSKYEFDVNLAANFAYRTPEVYDFSWEKILDRSGIETLLYDSNRGSKFTGISEI